MKRKGKVVDTYFYILHFKRLDKPKIIPFHYLTRRSAQDCLDKMVSRADMLYYKVVKGSFIGEHYVALYREGSFYTTKYRYPDEKATFQEKKNYRTMFRRRLRRMGILVVNNAPRRIDSPPVKPRYIKNTQDVAKSPTTIGRVVQIDRFSRETYVFINTLTKPKPKTKDFKRVLCKVEGYKFNLRKGTIKPTKFKIEKTDLVIPHSLNHLKEQCQEKELKIPEEVSNTFTKPLKRKGLKL